MKIALLTVFDENFREIADRTLPTMRCYANAFGLEFLSLRPDVSDRPTAWSKITRIREVLQSGFEYCFYIDTDALFVRFDDDIRDHLTGEKDLYLCWHSSNNSEPYEPLAAHYNTGVMVWRNSAWSIEFLGQIFRQTEFIDHAWWEQAALLNLLGYRSAFGQGDDDPVPDRNAHLQRLPVDWNTIVGRTIGPDPIIRHVAGRSHTRRLVDLDREIALQPVREALPRNARALLSRQLNLMSHQLREAGSEASSARYQAKEIFAAHDALLRSRSRLAAAWWRAARLKLGAGPRARLGREKSDVAAGSGDFRPQGLQQSLPVAAQTRRSEINSALIQLHGLSVVSGPFVGMKLLVEATWGDGDLSPKLLGCYEAELHPAIAEAVSRDPRTVINIGCAEGYYAVGMALALPQARVYAFDSDEKGQAICRRAAAANQVSQRIMVAGTCGIETIRGIISQDERPLLIVDCEGAELQLLDPAQAPEILQCDMIIECHDFINSQITPTLLARFASSHNIETVFEGPRDPNKFVSLQDRGSLDRWLAVNENRPVMMNWLVCWRRERPQNEIEPRP
jgi:hypothetical protein